MRRLLIATAAICITATVPFALADKKTIDDPKDAPGRVDIKTVSAGHDGSKLVHKAVGYAKIKKGEEPGLSVYAGKWDRVGGPSYQVSSFGVTDGRGMKTGKVTLKRPNGRTVVYKFGKGAIGNPKSYKWRFCVCPEGDQQDLAPKRPATHTLR
jgi:hypothetical protein